MTTIARADGYFLYHSIGQYPRKAADLNEAMGEFARIWSEPDDAQWLALLQRRGRFVARWAALIGAAEGTVTTAENVTAAVAALLLALPGLAGRRVLVAADCFPSVHFLLAGLAPRLGFTLDTVPLRQGAAWVEDEDMIARWDGDVALALLTWISSTSSHRCDLHALTAHGRAQGSLVGIDITQGAGLLPFDVGAPEVDFAVSTSLKWMCGTPGAGILYVAPPLIAAAAPALRGWFSQPDPFNWDIERFSYAPDIRRFDSGTPALMAALASLPALDWHAAQDHAAILAHNRSLSARLIEGADALGLPLASPRDPDQRGGSVMLRLPERLSAGRALEALRAAGCAADARGQVLRLSPGVMTTPDGVERALAALRGIG